MNLKKLFEIQKAFREKVGYNGEDRFGKLILALLVELGECANEWRGFKFWSKNQNPRIKAARAPYMDIDDADFYNPLLEEFVDGLAFTLEIGIELKMENWKPHFSKVGVRFGGNELVAQFEEVFRVASTFGLYRESEKEIWYSALFSRYLGLGEMLGFTWEQIEQAYYAKMQINHQRQATGY